MIDKGGRASFWGQYQLPVLAIAILSLALLVGCSSPSREELEAVDYALLPSEGWRCRCRPTVGWTRCCWPSSTWRRPSWSPFVAYWWSKMIS